MLYRYLFLGIVLIASLIMDLKSRRIDNRLILFSYAVALTLRIWMDGPHGFASYLTDLGLPVILLFLLFLTHTLGAGDIKLISVITCFTGFGFGLYIVWLSFLFTAFYAVIKQIREGTLIHLIQRKDVALHRIPFTVPLTISYVSCLGFRALNVI